MARRSGSSLRLLACAAALALTRPLAAQEPPRVIVSGSGDRVALATAILTSPISDDAIRSLVQQYLPDELQQTEPRQITLVVDANDQYVTSKVSKATVISAEGNGARFVFGDSTAANVGPVVIRRTNSGDASAAASGTVFSITTSRSDDAPAGVFGTGYSMTDIASIGVRRFTAGQLGTSAIIVSVVKLK